MSVADKMADHFVPEVDPNPAEPRMVIWSTLRCLELQIDQHEELYDSHGVVSWELLKHMVRLAKRHAHEEGGKAEAAERETDQWRTRADEANAKLRETEQELDRLRQQHVEVQSEEVAAARAEIETLRQELANAKRDASDEFTERQVLTVEQQQDAAAWQQQLDAARAEIETLKGAMAADDKRLRDAEEKVWPGATLGCDAAEKMADEILHLRQQLANAQRELSEQGQSHSVELQQETADLRKQLDAANAAVTLQRVRIERLRRVVDKVRQMLFKPNRDILYGDINGLRAAVAELDDANSSATLTSSVVKESLTTQAEGGQ